MIPAALLGGDLTVEDLPSSGRLVGAPGAAITDAWEQILTGRAMIRTQTDVPLPISPSGTPTAPLPLAAEIITKLGLWWRTRTAASPRLRG